VRIEVERIFGTAIDAIVAVTKDEKLNTVVQVELPTGDAGAVQKLIEALEPLPQSYNIIARPA
jgi:hypothetical protein